MRAKDLMTVQLISLLLLIASANSIFDSYFATFVFIVAFAVFSRCCIYAEKHQKRLLREINEK